SDDQRVADTVPLGPEVGRIGTVIASGGDNAKRARCEVEIQRTGTGPLNGVGGAISPGACSEDLITVDIEAVGELCLFEQILKGQQDRCVGGGDNSAAHRSGCAFQAEVIGLSVGSCNRPAIASLCFN